MEFPFVVPNKNLTWTTTARGGEIRTASFHSPKKGWIWTVKWKLSRGGPNRHPPPVGKVVVSGFCCTTSILYKKVYPLFAGPELDYPTQECAWTTVNRLTIQDPQLTIQPKAQQLIIVKTNIKPIIRPSFPFWAGAWALQHGRWTSFLSSPSRQTWHLSTNGAIWDLAPPRSILKEGNFCHQGKVMTQRNGRPGHSCAQIVFNFLSLLMFWCLAPKEIKTFWMPLWFAHNRHLMIINVDYNVLLYDYTSNTVVWSLRKTKALLKS